LHVTALVMTIVVWPYLAPPIALPPDILPVELMPVADETNIAREEKAPEVQDKPPEPAPIPQTIEPPPPPPPPETDDFAEPTPEPPPPTPEPPKPTPSQPRYAMLPPPRIKPKPEPKQKEFDVADIEKALKNVEKQQNQEPAPAPTKQAMRSTPGAGAQTAMTMSEIDALRSQMEKCWNVPVGAPDPAALVLRVKVFLNQDGTVASAPQLLDQGRLGDPYFRAAADSAIRAVHICGPYQLPPEKYATWSEITITFDPREMSGY
jgi:outer membrane biosynthesis protein TonB